MFLLVATRKKQRSRETKTWCFLVLISRVGWGNSFDNPVPRVFHVFSQVSRFQESTSVFPRTSAEERTAAFLFVSVSYPKTQTMRCPQCKNTTDDEKHTFCFKCGTKLEQDKETSSLPVDRDVTGNANEMSRAAQSSDVDNGSDVSNSLGKILLSFYISPPETADKTSR